MRLFINLKYGNIIKRDLHGRYVLAKPRNTWDMNYRLYDKVDALVYLVDVDDMDIDLGFDELKELAWKVKKDANVYSC